MNKNELNINYKIYQPLVGKSQNIYTIKEYVGITKLIDDEFTKLGYGTELIGKYLIVSVKGNKIAFCGAMTSNTSLLGSKLLKRKSTTKHFLSLFGIKVAKGILFTSNKRDKAWNYASKLKRCVVKPNDGCRGKGVTVGIDNINAFYEAWDVASQLTKRGILVEKEFIGGEEARYLVIGNKCVSVLKLIPPHVIGNGIDNILTLIKKKNLIRSKNPYLKDYPIVVDEHRLFIMNQQGYTMESIPDKDKVVVIDKKAKVLLGADYLEITKQVHPALKRIAEKASLIVPGLDLVGVDLFAYDHTMEPNASNYIVLEVNTEPGLRGHIYPSFGEPINVAGLIVENCLKNLTLTKN